MATDADGTESHILGYERCINFSVGAHLLRSQRLARGVDALKMTRSKNVLTFSGLTAVSPDQFYQAPTCRSGRASGEDFSDDQ